MFPQELAKIVQMQLLDAATAVNLYLLKHKTVVMDKMEQAQEQDFYIIHKFKIFQWYSTQFKATNMVN